MNKETILKKAIKKAEKNGYKPDIRFRLSSTDNLETYRNWIGNEQHLRIIYSHQFAKAFWGDEVIGEGKLDFDVPQIGYSHQLIVLVAYEYHLMMMVKEKDPLKYIEKFLRVEETIDIKDTDNLTRNQDINYD